MLTSINQDPKKMEHIIELASKAIGVEQASAAELYIELTF